jgi:hypothetical protein
MKQSHKALWYRLAAAALAFPLRQTSCVGIVERSMINGFFEATTPLLDERFKDWLTEVFATSRRP